MAKDKKIKQDWTTKRKTARAGKMAPAGQFFLVITVRKRYEAGMLVKRGCAPEAYRSAELHLREQIKNEYKI